MSVDLSGFRGRLLALRPLKKDIDGLVAWVTLYQSESSALVKIWCSTFVEAAPEQKLTLLYLINELLISRNMSLRLRFSSEIPSALMEILPPLLPQLPESVLSMFNRLFWQWKVHKVVPYSELLLIFPALNEPPPKPASLPVAERAAPPLRPAAPTPAAAPSTSLPSNIEWIHTIFEKIRSTAAIRELAKDKVTYYQNQYLLYQNAEEYEGPAEGEDGEEDEAREAQVNEEDGEEKVEAEGREEGEGEEVPITERKKKRKPMDRDPQSLGYEEVCIDGEAAIKDFQEYMDGLLLSIRDYEGLLNSLVDFREILEKRNVLDATERKQCEQRLKVVRDKIEILRPSKKKRPNP